MPGLTSIGERQLQRLDGHDVLFAERLRDFRRGHDAGRRAVGHAAAVEQTEGLGNERRIKSLLFGDRLAQMRLLVLGSVGVGLTIVGFCLEFVPLSELTTASGAAIELPAATEGSILVVMLVGALKFAGYPSSLAF